MGTTPSAITWRQKQVKGLAEGRGLEVTPFGSIGYRPWHGIGTLNCPEARGGSGGLSREGAHRKPPLKVGETDQGAGGGTRAGRTPGRSMPSGSDVSPKSGRQGPGWIFWNWHRNSPPVFPPVPIHGEEAGSPLKPLSRRARKLHALAKFAQRCRASWGGGGVHSSANSGNDPCSTLCQLGHSHLQLDRHLGRALDNHIGMVLTSLAGGLLLRVPPLPGPLFPSGGNSSSGLLSLWSYDWHQRARPGQAS